MRLILFNNKQKLVKVRVIYERVITNKRLGDRITLSILMTIEWGVN